MKQFQHVKFKVMNGYRDTEILTYQNNSLEFLGLPNICCASLTVACLDGIHVDVKQFNELRIEVILRLDF